MGNLVSPFEAEITIIAVKLLVQTHHEALARLISAAFDMWANSDRVNSGSSLNFSAGGCWV